MELLPRVGASVDELSLSELVRLGECAEVLAMRTFAHTCGTGDDGTPLLRTEELRGGLLVLAEQVPSPFFNRAFALGLNGPIDAAMLTELDRRYRAATPVALIQILDDQLTPELRARIDELGWQRADGWVKMVRDNVWPPNLRTELRIDPLESAHGERMGEILLEAFKMPPSSRPMARGMLEGSDWRFYGAFDGDLLVSVGALAMFGQVGYLAVGATASSHRNRGAQGALMARRLREGIRLGARVFVTETGVETPEHPNPSYHNMLRTGFREAYRRPDYLILSQ